MDTPPSRLCFGSTQASRWRHMPCAWTLTAPSLPLVLRPKPVKPVSPGFEAKPVKPSRTPPHDVTDSPVLRPNRSNR